MGDSGGLDPGKNKFWSNHIHTNRTNAQLVSRAKVYCLRLDEIKADIQRRERFLATGERTPLACGFRRLAETLVPLALLASATLGSIKARAANGA